MTDIKFLYNRYVRHRRIIGGYKYDFEYYAGGMTDEPYFHDAILKQGDLFLDVGANAGGWAIPASKYYKRVVAFEANPLVAKVLRKNIGMNHRNNIWVVPFAAGEGTGAKVLWHYPENGQDSFLKEHMGFKDIGVGTKVKMVALDDYKYNPTMIKIDTEGYELNVLKGAYQTIQRSRPRLAIETHDSRDAILIEKMFVESYSFAKFFRPTQQGQIILIGEPVREGLSRLEP